MVLAISMGAAAHWEWDGIVAITVVMLRLSALAEQWGGPYSSLCRAGGHLSGC